jgi:hypothetical protein
MIPTIFFVRVDRKRFSFEPTKIYEMKHLYLTLGLIGAQFLSNAQCQLGEIELNMHLYTDAWGEENYWELVPTGNGCGNGTIAWGGNENVGCDAIDPNNAEEGYLDNIDFVVGPFCVTPGVSLDLIFIDSYGDGGLNFEISEGTSFTQYFVGQGEGNVWTFIPGTNNLPVNDSPCNAINLEVDAAPINCNNETAIASNSEPRPVGGPCSLPGAWCDSDPNASNTLWYSFVAQANAGYEITTCNEAESFDTQLALYAVSNCNDYDTYELISSSDDMAGGCAISNGFASRMVVSCLEAGATYYIQLDGWQGAVGNTSLGIYSFVGEESLGSFVQDVNCPLSKGEASNGAIQLYVEGSGVNFTSTWTGSNNFVSSDNWVDGLEPGTYSVEVVSACGSNFSDTFEINAPDYWDVTITQDGPDCALSTNGGMSIQVTGATSPYTYAWTGPDGFSAQAEQLTDLNAGSYNYAVTDDNGCVYNGSIALSPDDSFNFDLGDDVVLCLDEVEVVVGPLDCDYVWQDGSNNQFFEIDAQSFGVGDDYAVILTATNEVGCTYTDAFIFSIEDCNSVNELEASGANIFPNPSNGSSVVQFDYIDAKRVVKVFSATGMLISNDEVGTSYQYELPNHLATGLYFVEISSGRQMERLRWIVK